MSAVVGRFPAILVSIVVITSIAWSDFYDMSIWQFFLHIFTIHDITFNDSLQESVFTAVYYLPAKVFSAYESVATYREVDSDDVSEPLLVIEEGGEVGDEDDEDGGHVHRHEVAEDVPLEDDLHLGDDDENQTMMIIWRYDLHRDSFHPIGKDCIRDGDAFEAVPEKEFAEVICISISAMSQLVNCAIIAMSLLGNCAIC